MAEELTADELHELRTLLEAEHTQLTRLLKNTKDGARPVDLDEPIGRLSRMDAIQQQQMTKATRASYERKLRLSRCGALDRRSSTTRTATADRARSPVGFRRLECAPGNAVLSRVPRRARKMSRPFSARLASLERFDGDARWRRDDELLGRMRLGTVLPSMPDDVACALISLPVQFLVRTVVRSQRGSLRATRRRTNPSGA